MRHGTYVRDPLHGEIFVPDELLPLLNNHRLQRLRGIRQMGLAHLVYPAATHNRFAHSLGVYHIARHGTESPAVWAYALIHDAGHGPFSHLSEYALMKNGVKFDHDAHLRSIAPDILHDSVFSPKEVLKNSENAVVSGGVGADRLDYLLRDSYFAGVRAGEISWDRIMRNSVVRDGEQLVAYKVLANVEHVLVARFIMGDAVYLHKTVLIANEMFVRAVRDLLDYYKPKEIVEMDDAAIISAFRAVGSKWWSDIENRRLFKAVAITSDRRDAEEVYGKLVAEMGEDNVVLAERPPWHKSPEVLMEDGKRLEDVSPLVASLHAADHGRQRYIVAVRR